MGQTQLKAPVFKRTPGPFSCVNGQIETNGGRLAVPWRLYGGFMAWLIGGLCGFLDVL